MNGELCSKISIVHPIICLIPILGRHDILKITLGSLKQQTTPVTILLIVSNETDRDFAINEQVDWVYSPNQPLGLKFQNGIKRCRDYQPLAVLINGSDDFLSPNWVEKLTPHLKTYDLIGKSSWFLSDSISNKTYSLSYKRDRTLGAGRLISAKILDKINWELYPIDKKKSLDKASLKKIKSNNGKSLVYQSNDIFVISLKSDQPMMNPTTQILTNLYIKAKPINHRCFTQLIQGYQQKDYPKCLDAINSLTSSKIN